MKIEGIVFDKDGTLIDLAAFWHKPVKHTIGVLQEKYGFDLKIADDMMIASGLNLDGSEIYEGLITCGTNLDVAIEWKHILDTNHIKVTDAFIVEARDMLGHNSQLGVLKGETDLEALLGTLKEKGYKLGIATSDDYDQTAYSMKELGVIQYFDSIVCADMVKLPKPATDIMEMIQAEWEISPGHIMMVGDSINDMKFAKNCGVPGVYYNKTISALPDGAAYCIDDLNKIFDLLNKF